jgi:hypothetical protein
MLGLRVLRDGFCGKSAQGFANQGVSGRCVSLGFRLFPGKLGANFYWNRVAGCNCFVKVYGWLFEWLRWIEEVDSRKSKVGLICGELGGIRWDWLSGRGFR